ncbi:protoheme IX farnesyltransferase [Intrasporangium chromatireducens Q5-1]|uniref:Protoheme IX farnesyltransferase n=1 Tax=Intrasporangium chromatireducens Q5-1 TaxID=584657 RepID=W9GUY1_9MICO|nr:heme o synthase [Intrasporangium chromatireducens]EWT07679.1 protoheme IX farnesyltransferase [Intrasporangium chromatireducens Q5-1]
MTAEALPTTRVLVLRTRVAAYVALTKPRIVELLLVTTLPAMLLAARGWPPTGTVVATLVGGSAAAGCANAFNCLIDRDIDEKMRRTSRRPLPRTEVSPSGAATLATALGVGSLALLAVTTTPLATALTATAILVYVVGYTMVLKRRTPSNIVWGGAAGCLPTLIGWAAVTGSVSWSAAVMFLIVFFWTPPHFWALAMRFREDYATAEVPMLPVVVAPAVVVARVRWYTAAMVATSLLLVPVAPTGPLYAVSAVALGAYFGWEVHLLSVAVRAGGRARPLRVFHASITYLSCLFLALGIDVFLHR